MEILSLVLAAAVLVGLELLWLSPATESMEALDLGEGDGGNELAGEVDPFTPEFLQRRLHALSDELDRLDRDPDVFAKAFHTLVARSAYQALLADASRLTHRLPAVLDPTVDVDLAWSSTTQREVLEI
jgi:hypothetical protein